MSDLIETIARAIWDKKTNAEYPWWHTDFDQCRLARDLARAALCALTQHARGHRDFADLGDGWVLTKAHEERPPLTDREVTDFKASVLSSATHLLESEGLAVVPKVPTNEIIQAITDAGSYAVINGEIHAEPKSAGILYAAMLSGRPKVTEQ